MAFFTIAQEKLMRRVLVFQEQIAESKLHETPCPLLLTQIKEMRVLTDLLSTNLWELSESIEKRNKS